MYGLISRLVQPFPYTNKTCEKGDKQSMATDTSSTPPWESLCGLQILPELGPYYWRSVAWMEGIPVYGLLSRLVKP